MQASDGNIRRTRDLQNKEEVLDAVAEKVRSMRTSPTRKNKQLSKAEALSRGVSPTKLEMTGRVGTAPKTKKIEPYVPKTVEVREFNQQNWPTLSNVNVTVGD